MSAPLETLRGFVNTWDCDENAHMNVQHYFRCFDDASRLSTLLGARSGEPQKLPKTRHVRFHAELLAGAPIRILSAQVTDGPFSGWVIHNMENIQTGALAATALEPADGLEYLNYADNRFREMALPRSLAADPDTPESAESMISGGGLVSHRRIVQPGHCDVDGMMQEQFYVSCFTDAAPHLWEHVNIGTCWLIEKNFGRVAVEMKITHHGAVHAGEALALYSRPVAVTGKTTHLRHELVCLDTPRPVASGEVVGLVIDLATRKAVPVPGAALRTQTMPRGGQP